MINSMASVQKAGVSIKSNTQVSFNTAKNRDRADLNSMEDSTKETFLTDNFMAMASTFLPTQERFTKENSRRITWMERAP